MSAQNSLSKNIVDRISGHPRARDRFRNLEDPRFVITHLLCDHKKTNICSARTDVNHKKSTALWFATNDKTGSRATGFWNALGNEKMWNVDNV